MFDACQFFEIFHWKSVLSSIFAVGIAPELIFTGGSNLDIPGVNTDVTHRPVKRGVDGSVQMAGTDTFLGIICAIVEIPRLLFIRLPKCHVLWLHATHPDWRIIGAVVANHRPVHSVTGELLPPLGK